MIILIAVSEIIKNGRIVGYKVRAEGEKETRDITIEALDRVLKSGQAKIPNIKKVGGNLVIVPYKKEETHVKETKVPIVSKDKVEERHVENKVNDDKSDVDRIKQLVKILNKARAVYEQGKDEIMSNYEYDKLYDELLALESKTGTVLANSPTQNVGYEVVSELQKETHEFPMLSLDKTKDRESLVGWLQGKEGVLSWKLDGLTVVLTYDNGKLVKAVTRGNGTVGELVTNNAMQFKNVPHQISFKGKLVLRGEATISYSAFNKINDTIVNEEDKYKNPRNLCSGSVRQLDSSITAKRNVRWYCFELVSAQGMQVSNNIDEQFKWLKTLGFDCVEHLVVNGSNVVKAIGAFEKRVANNDIPSDGLVITFRDKKFGLSLGRTAKFYRHSMAFKWQDETSVSTMKNVEWQVGRTGVITPVAIFEPIDIEGSTVERASVHNVSIFLDLRLGLGDRVEIYKANLIIPQINENLDRTGTFEIPGTCPCCGAETEVRQDPKSGVYTLWCTNEDCGARGISKFKHFVLRDAMNIDGISGATIQALVDESIVTDFVSIYHIKEHMNEIVNMEGFGVQSFNKMVNAIEKSRNVKPHNFIYALGIPNVGLSTAKLICNEFDNELPEIIGAEYSDLVSIEGVGDVIAQSFVDYFNDDDNFEMVTRLVTELSFIKPQSKVNNSMQGITICVTGAVNIFPNRKAVQSLIESLGGKLTGSVSRSTNYLVTNDTSSGSKKNQDAKKYNIPILTEQEFIDKFNLSQYIK